MLNLLDIEFTETPHEIWNSPDERSNVLSFYTGESLSIVNEMFAIDFQTFGYEKILP